MEIFKGFTCFFVEFFDRLQRDVLALPPVDLAATTGDDFGTLEGEGQVQIRLTLQKIFLRQNFVLEKWIFVAEFKIDPEIQMFVLEGSPLSGCG